MRLRYLETASQRGLVGGKEKSLDAKKQGILRWDLLTRFDWRKSESRECGEDSLGQACKLIYYFLASYAECNNI